MIESLISIFKSLFKEREPLAPLDFEVSLNAPLQEMQTPVKLVMQNDDYTPMDFVMKVLETYLKMETKEAGKVMLHIHNNGEATIAQMERDSAEQLVQLISQESSKRGYRLSCVIENI